MFGLFKKKKTPEDEQADLLAELRALPKPAMDFTTPEGAILCLEDAYRRRDIEAAVACKQFRIEAGLMLLNIQPEMAEDEATVAKTAEVLELSFRKHLSESWPNMEGLEVFFVEREQVMDGIYVVTELALQPDGTIARSDLQVASTADGWRVLNPISPDESE